MKKTNQTSTDYVVNTNAIYHTPDFWTSTTSQQFNEAMVMFNSHNLKIAKNGVVNITASAKRNYIKLDDIMNEVRPLLAELGLYIEQHLAGDSLITRIVHISVLLILYFFFISSTLPPPCKYKIAFFPLSVRSLLKKLVLNMILKIVLIKYGMI